MLVLTLALSMQLAADARPEAWVVVTRRSGVARPQALDLARIASTALTERGVPNPIPPEDAAVCNAKVPCLVDLAQKKGVSVVVTVEAGSAHDDVVLHLEALSVEEYGKKLSTFDYSGPANGFSANVKEKIEEFFAPAVRGVLGIGRSSEPVAEVKPPPETKPAPVVNPVPVEPVQPVQAVVVEKSGGGITPMRVAGLVIAGVGAAVLISSLALGIKTLGTNGQRNSLCASNPCTNPMAYDLYSAAGGTQTAGITTLVIGAVLAAAGLTLFFVDFGGGSSGTVVPSTNNDGMSLSFVGRF